MCRLNIFLLALIIGGCSNNETEFFCESYHLMPGRGVLDGRPDISYSQQVIKLSPNRICVNWRGDEPTCIKKDSVTVEPWEVDSNGVTRSRHSFRANFMGDVATITVSELTEPTKPSDITIIKRGDELFFVFQDVPLNLGLPIKFDSEENRKTFQLYAINNKIYWNGNMISDFKLSYEKEPKDINSYSVNGQAYKSYFARANDKPNYQYIFNTKSLSLTSKRENDDYDPVHKYTCEVWNKKNWWSL